MNAQLHKINMSYHNIYIYIMNHLYMDIHMYVYRCFIRCIVEIVFTPPMSSIGSLLGIDISNPFCDTVYLGVRLAQTSAHPGIEHG